MPHRLPPLPEDRPAKVLFVCLGNICRSPLAEGLFRHHVERAGLGARFVIDSAGTGGWHAGEPPHPGSRAVARRRGRDISDQRARQVTAADLVDFDLIAVMDAQNLRDMQALANGRASTAVLARLLDLAPSDHRRDVPDPYGEPDAAFDDVYDLLDGSTSALLEAWRAIPAEV
ncbi:MAG: low molecular weight protein-tyrosine-phosphatase [Candidatus Sericytochromatia bacterium]|nr:low molecular weight protein-tyrosine-phosphatase [Candidatus Sericytochromatia bacterium]